jgi:hypothetical protein
MFVYDIVGIGRNMFNKHIQFTKMLSQVLTSHIRTSEASHAIGQIIRTELALFKTEMLSFAGKWMELENIILSEVSLAQKIKNRMFSLICGH